MFNKLSKIYIIVGLISLLFISPILKAADKLTKLTSNPEVIKFINEMAAKPEFDKKELTGLFEKVEIQQSIIDAMNRPYEARPWHDYRQLFLTDRRINEGVAFWQQNEETLKRAEKEFGVPAEIIVAIIGVETFYGRIQGNHRVIDALSTLAFAYPRRADYFRRELTQFLHLAKELEIDPTTVKGSYAGAIGKGQFMPSSYRHYAVDFAGTGKIDLRNNTIDVIGSVANYFKQHGWKSGDVVVTAAKVKGDQHINVKTQTRQPNYVMSQLVAKGITAVDNIPDDSQVMLVKMDGKDKQEFYLGLHNFYVITRYNTSKLYALAVYQLAKKIESSRNTAIASLANANSTS